ncbi:hypothetical protein [Solicola sp. PLA-1-18]|uniref:hypothetical protein n=1 Tax=Solicola sp. PLA-1-18 TaxID=3380532 RepID=UPI003B823277
MRKLCSTVATAVVLAVPLTAVVVASDSANGEIEIVSHTTGTDGEIEIVSVPVD